MGNGFMTAGGSGLPDRNTVGKNGAIGLNSAFPNVALNVGADCETETALDGNAYFAIKAPKGEYKGESYVGASLNDVAAVSSGVYGRTSATLGDTDANTWSPYASAPSEGVYIILLTWQWLTTSSKTATLTLEVGGSTVSNTYITGFADSNFGGYRVFLSDPMYLASGTNVRAKSNTHSNNIVVVLIRVM